MSRKIKMGIILCVDTVLIVLANLLVQFYLSPIAMMGRHIVFYMIVLQLLLYVAFGVRFRVFSIITRYSSFNSIMWIFCAWTAAVAVEYVAFGVFNRVPYLSLQLSFVYCIALVMIVASRITWRLLMESQEREQDSRSVCRRALIIGAGNGGELLYSTIKNKPGKTGLDIVGFIDDDPNKQGTLIHGLQVIGKTEDLPRLIEEQNIEVLTVAIPSMTSSQYEGLLDKIKGAKVQLYSIPSLEELATGQVSVSKLREVDVVDLLGRDEVQLDMDAIKTQITNQTILVTGAGGSIGSEICRQVMAFSPRELILLGHGENSIYLIEKELRQTYADKRTIITPVIAEIRDASRMEEVMEMHKPDIVYHAAAHKHVPLMEYNPEEALKNNVYGTKNVALAALKAGVHNFVMVSTDKAVNPPNVMGATKRIAEMIVTGLNGRGQTQFSAVRFGNVLGSRGSVVPLFKEQIAKGGPVTVTDFRMTRYFMTIPEASRLVIQSGALAQGGEIFILDMGEPVKIVDLARKVIKLSGYTTNEIEVVESGIRPGEKLYEELLVDKERSNKQVHDKIFVGNVKGFGYDEVLQAVSSMSDDPKILAKQLVEFANRSSEG